MSLMNNRKSLFISVCTGAFVFLGIGYCVLNPQEKVVQKPAPEYQYVVAKVDIKKDSKIKEDDVEIKEFPISIEGAYKATGEIIGRSVNKDIEAGKPVVKNFIVKLELNDKPTSIEPETGFRAVPMLIKKTAMPPYLSTDARFDLFTRENTMKIENLKILNVLSPTDDKNNKMLILEIANKDVSDFIKYQVQSKGFIFLQKNPDEYGSYKFYDLEKIKQEEDRIKEEKELQEMMKLYAKANIPEIPPIDKIDGEIIDAGNIKPEKQLKQVEIIVGSTKSKVEFED